MRARVSNTARTAHDMEVSYASSGYPCTSICV